MASQSPAFESISTPAETPTTPQPLEAELPSEAEIQVADATATSMVVAPSSMTPPPSTQVLASGNAGSADKMVSARPTLDQIENATPEELKQMTLTLMAENVKLDGEGSEARMSAAHWKLQYNLLTIENEQAIKLMQVEHEMVRREVLLLQMQGREMPKMDEYAEKLRAYCQAIRDDNAIIRRRLEKAKQVIEMKDGEIMDAKDEIFRLQTRIRQNREHINTLRSPGGPLHMATPKTSPATPHNYRGTPKRTPTTSRANYGYSEHPEARSGFSALIEAGNRVLNLQSQENNSAPTTPSVPGRADSHNPNRHSRAVQSLSSFVTTPASAARALTGPSALLPSAQFSADAENRVVSTLSHHATAHQETRGRPRRRDSTISASDADEARRVAHREVAEVIKESHASQSATKMLRANARESFDVAPSRASTPLTAEELEALEDAKLYGTITKRRKRVAGALDDDDDDDDDEESESEESESEEDEDEDEVLLPSPAKRARIERVGLGIGFQTRA